MEKTLYLSESKNIEVLRDGPSIWVKEDGKAVRRIPARLIGRVVIIGNLRLEAGVITIFTENEVPVTLMNQRGEELAVIMRYNHHLPTHYEEQKLLLKTEGNIHRVKTWIISRRKAVQISIVKRLSKEHARRFYNHGFREKDYQSLLSKFKPSNNEKWKTISNIVSNLFRELIIGCVMRAGLDPHLGVLYRRCNFSFALDICHILEAESDIQCIQFFKTSRNKNHILKDEKGWYVSREGMKDIIQRFENRKRFLYMTVERLIDDIFEIMRELRRYEG